MTIQKLIQILTPLMQENPTLEVDLIIGLVRHDLEAVQTDRASDGLIGVALVAGKPVPRVER